MNNKIKKYEFLKHLEKKIHLLWKLKQKDFLA